MGVHAKYKLTAYDLKYIRENYERQGSAVIGRKLNYPRDAIYRNAVKMGLKFLGKKPEHIVFIKEHYPAKGARFCAEKLCRSNDYVYRIARKFGIRLIKMDRTRLDAPQIPFGLDDPTEQLACCGRWVA